MVESGIFGAVPDANKVRVFVSYDRQHDGDLHARLLGESEKGGSGFEISGRSAARAANDLAEEGLRRAIREADEVIAICGEHTAESGRMGAELRIAQEEGCPYFLLWGRREIMCTKPTTAKPTDSMYSWTREILEAQISTLRRLAESDQRVAEPGPGTAPPSG